MGWYIGLGTIPIAIFGFALPRPDRERRALAVPDRHDADRVGLLLLLADRTAKRDRDITEINGKDAALIGFAQALALIPGVSRSGATITAGLFAGFDRASAARYSFLLSVPAVVLSGLFEVRKIGDEGGVGSSRRARHDGGVHRRLRVDRLAAAMARLALDTVFVVYRVALGALVIALAAAGAISAS